MTALTIRKPPTHKPQAYVERETPFRWTVAQYHSMIAAGILTSDDRVELLEGEIVIKMSKNPPHTHAKRMLRRALERLLKGGYFLDEEGPITTLESEPEPDISVIRGIVENFQRHARPKDVPLVIEIADTSLRLDRTTKYRIYARGGIPIYWIVNLVERTVEVYSAPKRVRGEARYLSRQDYSESQRIPVMVDGVEIGKIKVVDLMPTK